MAERNRVGAIRKHKKGPTTGSGGNNRKRLAGKGPTPKAEDRPYHKAAKAKAARERAAAGSGAGGSASGAGLSVRKSGGSRGGSGSFSSGGRGKPSVHKQRGYEIIHGRNAVLEALQARIPATVLYLADGIEPDDRVRDAVARASGRNIPVMTVSRQDLERMLDEGSVHQGIALQIPPYKYAELDELVSRAGNKPPLLVALDGVTDPRNLGAIIRSVAAFGGHGVIIPERRSAGVTAAAWKTSAGAALRTKVAMVPNLTQALKDLKQRGLFVVGLAADGEVQLPELELAAEPLVVVVGSEGKGISRLVRETCDELVSIPITQTTESLNAGIAGAVALYEVATQRAKADL